jgi:hypothetical protein
MAGDRGGNGKAQVVSADVAARVDPDNGPIRGDERPAAVPGIDCRIRLQPGLERTRLVAANPFDILEVPTVI